MKKSDVLLAKKVVAAKEVKAQSQAIKSELRASRASGSRAAGRAPGSLSRSATSSSSALPALSSPTPASSSFSFSQAPPDSPTTSSSFPATFSRTPATSSSMDMSKSLSAPSLSIVNELAQRATTGKTELRKLQYSVSQSLSSTTPSSSLRPQTTSRLPSSSSVALAGAGGRSLEDENFFLPKRRLLRADGASLADVYHSKQEDMWGKIIQAQVKEEEVRKVAQQRQQEEANKRYGVELKRQIVSNRKRAEEERVDHERFAQLEHLYAKKYEDLEKNRNEEAIQRHRQFIQHAMEDMASKHEQRQKELTEELTASAIMISHAKQMMQAEEAKRQADRDYQRRYQETIYEENVVNLRRRELEKAKAQEEDRRIIAENERQHAIEQARREEEFRRKMKKSTEGPAHHMVQNILSLKNAREEAFFQTLIDRGNSLNKQLYASEEALRKQQLQKKQQEEDRNNKIFAAMQAMIAKQEEEEARKKQLRREAAGCYQKELDQQVRDLRQRSIDSLTKTMSETERKYNLDLLKKSAAFL
eukprot:gene1406-1531_t